MLVQNIFMYQNLDVKIIKIKKSCIKSFYNQFFLSFSFAVYLRQFLLLMNVLI